MIWDLPPKLWTPPRPGIIRPAPQQASFLPGMFPAGAAVIGVRPVSLAFVPPLLTNVSGLTTYTYTSAIPSRAYQWIAVILSLGTSASNGRTISTVTAAGISAAPQVDSTFSSGGSSVAGIYTAVIPASTSGNIVIEYSGSMNRSSVALYEMRHAAGVTAHDMDSSVADVSQVMSGALNIPANGAAIGLVYNNSTSSSTDFTWSNLGEDFDLKVDGTERAISGAHAKFAAAQTGLAITATSSTSMSFENFVLASWGPALV